MGVALRKYHRITRSQTHRGLTVQLHIAISFGDQMEDHYAFSAGLQKGRC